MIIFLSYASEQRDIAEEIKLALAAGENIGWSCNDCHPSKFMLTKLTYLAYVVTPLRTAGISLIGSKRYLSTR